jgi:hypothetical protein
VLNDKSGSAVFSALGPSDEGKNWRMYRYEGGKTTEIANLSSLNVEPGKGYWLISRNSVTISPGPGMVVDASEAAPFTITLTSGWNQIGNPYLYNVLWSDVNTLNATSLALRTFNGQFGPGTILTKFSGGFVQTDLTTLALKIPTAKNPSAGREQAIEPKTNPLDSRDWEVIVNVRNGDQVNPFGGVGMSEGANIGYDHFDDFTLPRFLDFVEFNHGKKAYGMTYAKDIVPLQDSFAWSVTVESMNAGTTELTWDNHYFGDNGRNLVLWDEDEQFAIDMRKHRSYSFNQVNGKKFRIFYGNDEFITSQTEAGGLLVHSLSPNPADGEVKVAFTIPGNGTSNVNVRVVNGLGQQIAQIFEGQLNSGYHEMGWSGRDAAGVRPAQGVYLVEVVSGDMRESRRLVIK